MKIRRIAVVVTFATLVALAGCDDDSRRDGGADADTDADTDVDGDTDADGDADADGEANGAGDAEPDLGEPGDGIGEGYDYGDGYGDDDGDVNAGDEAVTPETEAEGGGFEAEEWVQPLLFDMDAIGDPLTADCQFSNHRTAIKDTTLLDVWDVSYTSWESIDGELVPIRISGFAASPASASMPLPGVVQAHGLGGCAKESHATGSAHLLQMFTLAYTGPGGGAADAECTVSEGHNSDHDSGYRMFDTIPDLRGTWFWSHAVAGMRGLTCLEHHPGVLPDKLGMTGFSAGSVVTLISAGRDNRIKAAVPLSGTGAWDVATQSPAAWQNDLLTMAGLDVSSEQWQRLIDSLITPAEMVGGASAAVFMVNGSSDEFFPLTAHSATFDAVPTDKRHAIAGNFDHGCYSLMGIESPETIEQRADLRATGAQRAWFHHYFGTDADYAYIPEPPQVQITPAGAVTGVTTSVDGGGSELDVERVKFWWSNDAAYLFGSVELGTTGGIDTEIVAASVTDEASIYYVDVQYKTRVLFPERFSVSSAVHLPPGLVPHIRSLVNCQ